MCYVIWQGSFVGGVWFKTTHTEAVQWKLSIELYQTNASSLLMQLCWSKRLSLCLPGNRTYISYVYMECTFNNSVLRTFTKLLQDTVKRRTRRVGGGRVHPRLHESASIQRDLQRAGSASSEENEGLEFILPLFSLSSVVQILKLFIIDMQFAMLS